MSVQRNCQGVARRDFLRLGLGALGLGTLARWNGSAQASSATGVTAQAKSCILVWMDGGPSHYETFDPKPDAPAEIRGELTGISTRLPGVQFCECMPKLSAIADKFAVIRSVRHDQNNHGAGNHYMMTGSAPAIPVACGAYVSFHPSLGAVAARELGGDSPLPAYFAMPSMPRSGGPNFLGARYAPFVLDEDPNRPSFRVRDVALPLGINDGRFADRRRLRALVDRMPRDADPIVADPAVAMDEYYTQGNRLVLSPAAQRAFEIDREPDRVRDQYGRGGFGQRMLLARRLVEAEVPFVTIQLGGWDHHDDIFNRIRREVPPFEAALAALVTDLDQRGLLDSTLVVALGEFGRTPKVYTIDGRTSAGRDHWSNAMSIFIAGGGTPGGQIVGATDRQGYAACERILRPENFVSTVYAKLGIDPNKIYQTPAGRPVHLVSDPTPIRELMG